ncbi:uracil-DNA glycosylase [Patescibacteria group bacterium]|nr:uracil-DNA glycosylase [Patescibacteria group bacterium]MDE1946583.1 uracil-DNA glycosylase [Patescibacteria group bacterium]MDE2010856.1 uracil-DNA glycosylase [Patescibacteria group bacterium]MDE2233210.1 uracil-DNA glycosylase [Patescibacteria group bacterium]
MTKYDQMKAIRDELLVFEQSPLYEYRTANKYFPVVGEGSHDAAIMFVGEAPGLNEAKTGKPFCGAAGKFLTELFESIGVKREQVYVTNIVKDRPPENRDPTPEEIALYSPFLDRQVKIIQPKVIATLGRHSMGYVMRRYDLDLELDAISKIHGKSFETAFIDDDNKPQPLTIVTLYHPASALYNGGMRETHKKDFEILRKYA